MADISNKLNKESADLAGTFVEIKTNTSDFGVALTEATKSMAEFSQQYKKTAEDIPAATKGIMASLKAALSKAGGAFKKVPGLTRLAALGPLGAITSAATLLFKQLMQVSDTIADLSKSTGLVGKQLKTVFKEVKAGAAGMHAFGIGLKEAGVQASALIDSLGNANKVTGKLIDVTARVAKAMGGSAQESAALADNLIRGFGKTAPQVEKFAQSIMTFATKSGVNARKVMRDISNDSNLTAIYLSRGEDYMAKTAVMAAKMGKSMADNLATTDAFLNIESGSDLTGRLNNFFGSNLNALKMYNMAVKQDTVGVMKELNTVFSSPKGIAMIQKYPGIAKQLGAELGLNVKDMKQLGKVIQDMDKAARGPTKEQMKLNDFIKQGMTLWEQLKGLVASALMPLFTELGTMLNDQIKPFMNDATDMARAFGKSINEAMSGAKGLGPKLKAAFSVLATTLSPIFTQMGNAIGSAFMGGVANWFKTTTLGRVISAMMSDEAAYGATAGMIGGAVVGGGVGSVPMAAVGGVGGYLAGAYSAFQGSAPAVNATGQVHRSPTLALVGEEHRSEVVIPTERLRKGMPVSNSVSRELSSIGVPGFALGGGGASAAAVASSGAAQRRRSQQSMVYGSQGDPNAIKRREQKIEQQAAQDRAAQRVLVNDIMKQQEALARSEYFNSGAAVPTPGGGGGGKGPGQPGRSGRDWGKTMHNMAKGLDKFMKLTNTTWKDMWNTMPDRITKPSEKLFNKLPENIKEGLTAGVETAWNHYLETGKLQEAMAMGAAEGIRTATAQSGEFTQAAGNIVAGMLEGKGWREGLGVEMSKSLNDPKGFLGEKLEKLNFNAEMETDAALASHELFKGDQAAAQAQADKAEKMYKEAKEFGGTEAQTAPYKKKMQEAQKLAKQAGKDATGELLKGAGRAGLAAGGAAGLSAGISSFAETGSFKEAGKAAAISGGGAAASTALTTALTPALGPLAPLVGGIGGQLVSAGLSKLFGGGDKAATGGAARAKLLGGLGGALRLSKKPGGEQLYEAFKNGSGLNEMAKKNIDAAMRNSSGQMDEGLRGELIGGIGSVITRSTGVQLNSDEIMTLMAAIKGTGMQNHEQKSLLTQFERRFEGVGARGAVVNRPTVALIGEAGPEVVTPLDQTRGNGPLPGGGGDLAGEIRQMNRLLSQYVSNPPPINIDGQRVSRVINAANSDDIRTGVSTVNSRI
jgi:hypothetical protein